MYEQIGQDFIHTLLLFMFDYYLIVTPLDS